MASLTARAAILRLNISLLCTVETTIFQPQGRTKYRMLPGRYNCCSAGLLPCSTSSLKFAVKESSKRMDSKYSSVNASPLCHINSLAGVSFIYSRNSCHLFTLQRLRTRTSSLLKLIVSYVPSMTNRPDSFQGRPAQARRQVVRYNNSGYKGLCELNGIFR